LLGILPTETFLTIINNIAILTTLLTILTFQPIKASIQSFTKLSEDRQILFLEPAVKAKMLTFVLPTEKRLVVSFWTVFRFLRTQGELE